ncbi:MAG: hypothetical protein CVT49_01420 [candidate division Zixibacteria bacterium HGW-Zixibacteria-1]|nr:MAG: hypothetical protein CVT49_01420 [candidate division Zixibacteria bacterium HGW-Zixibacteria-1]
MQESPGMNSGVAPVRGAERIASVDILRGVAVLGILGINIYFFALPGAVMFNPSVAGGFLGLNLLTWQFTSLLFLQKMMGIFSMLFGAGIIMMYDKAEKAGRKFGGIHYRRMLWLLVLGLAHAYLIWHGDVLVTYAVCGMILFLFRRRSPRTLIILSLIVFIFGILMQLGASFNFAVMKESAAAAEQSRRAGKEISPSQEKMIIVWEEINNVFSPPDEAIRTEIDAYRGKYLDVLKFRMPVTLMMQTQALFFIIIWRALGLMLLGMALMKLGVFSALRSIRFYIFMTVIGFGIGLPVVIYGIKGLMAHNFDFIYQFREGLHYNYIGSILTALGHVGLIMLIYKFGILRWLTRCLAAVGRTALSNYLLHSIVFTTIFYGYGLGLFGRIERFYLMWFVVVMWIINLTVSPLWLRHFRFGPAEWLWRTLTYRKRQPMRV